MKYGFEQIAKGSKQVFSQISENKLQDRGKVPGFSACIYLETFYINKTATGCGSVWLERCVRDAEAGGSNPLTPTICEDNGTLTMDFHPYQSSVFYFRPNIFFGPV